MITSMQRLQWASGMAHRPVASTIDYLLSFTYSDHPIDPPKAAKAFYELATMKDPPLRC
jgi:hypothetical protein